MKREYYWLWLCNIKGIGKVKRQVILKYFNEPKKAFYALENEIIELMNNFNVFNKQDIENFIHSRDEKKIIKLHNKIMNMGISYVSIEHRDYPARLKNIFDPPYIIYYRGKLPKEDKKRIAIIGSRKCSLYGKNIAEYFAKELAKNNIVVVSGMARGIDSSAHIGAIKGTEETVAVLGSGVNVCYPKENIKLMNLIIENGCVISEVPINSPPLQCNFPLRNRIISGLSDAVLVVEAAKKSGSLITCDLALEQGKDVYAIPGRITDKMSFGTNKLIQMGAKLVLSVDDILEELINNNKNNSDLNLFKNDGSLNDLNDLEKSVFSNLSFNPIHINDLAKETKLSMNKLQFTLISLELKGIIEQLPSQYIVKKI